MPQRVFPMQTSFNSGEFSPRMEGRIDVDQYFSAVRRMENWLPLISGAALKRSGFRHVKEVKDSDDFTRLIRFEFSTEQAYALEFGDLYMRVFFGDGAALEASKPIDDVDDGSPNLTVTVLNHGLSNGDEVFIDGSAQDEINGRYFKVTNVVGVDFFDLLGEDGTGRTTGAGGTVARVYEIVSPYTSAELDAIQTAQSADVLYVAHPDHPPQKIERTGHTSWTITEIEFDWPPRASSNLDDDKWAAYADGKVITTEPLFTADHEGGFFFLSEAIEEQQPEWVSAARWGAAGFQDERLQAVNDRVWYEGNVYSYETDPDVLQGGVSAPVHVSGRRSDGVHILEYLHSGHGYVRIDVGGVIDEYTATATVIKTIPDGASVPPADTKSLLSIQNDAGGTVRTNAAAHNYNTGDKILLNGVAGMDEVNNRVFTITVIDPDEFSLNENTTTYGTHTASTGTAYRVQEHIQANNRNGRESNKWAMGAWSAQEGFPRAVTFFEDRLVWAGAAGSPQTIWLSKTGDYESHEITPDDSSAIVFTLNNEQVNAIESMSSSNAISLFTSNGEFTLSSESAGAPLTPSNFRSSRQTTYGARTNVGAIRVENATLFVQRAGRRIREFIFDADVTNSFVGIDLNVFADHVAINQIKKIAYQQEPHRIVWCITDTGELIGLTYERSQDVVGWHTQPLGGADVVVESITTIPHPDGNQDRLWAVISRTIDGATRRYVEYLEEDWLRTFDIENAFFVDSGLTYDGPATVTMRPLNHLEGEVVAVLADGVYAGMFTVADGAITLDTAASKVQIGLSYEAVIETLRIEAGAQDGVAQGRVGRIDGLVIRVDQTGVGLLFGPDEENLDRVQIDDGDLLDGDTNLLRVDASYDQERRLFVKHDKPTPCTLIATMPQLAVGKS